MKFGLFLEWPNPTLRNWKTLFEEGVQQVQYSEEMGFDYCLIAEHHFTNYGNSPAPLMQALYIGQRTRRIKIGTASVILPVWQPLRLAEEIAVLDNLIDGRFRQRPWRIARQVPGDIRGAAEGVDIRRVLHL